ncbi:sulfite exporter TauE/SafE family protein [Marinihelvus fidelis]|uniref:sulfite exporter TauE/SafE family protein n=1 Tax=Marinihelvus fidelis TaxID=2613842 RepID=UPI001782B07D|nr:sulfite exporter TauE/SafE family protein [Marinihelvus fidelis]
MSPVDLVVIGAIAGFLAGFLGIGGGLVIVPALTLLFSRDSAYAPLATHMAVATSLAVMLVTSLSSIVAHARRRAVDWPQVGRFVPGLLVGAAIGAVLADHLDTRQLALVFALFVTAAGIQLLVARTPEKQRPQPGKAIQAGVATVIGALSSMVGIGGGSLTAPWLMWHGSLPQRAVATAAACGYPIAVAGALTFVVLGRELGLGVTGYVDLQAFAGIAIAGVLTAPIGAAVVHHTDPARVRKIFGFCLLAVAARMAWGA